MNVFYFGLWVVFAYLLGSLSFAVIVSRFMGLSDPRSYGSGNPGATNVLRSGSKKAAVLTLLFDALKGFLPVFLSAAFLSFVTSDKLDSYPTVLMIQAFAGFAAFLGHLFPVFFGFKGGKGVATAVGVLLGFNWMLGLFAIFTWLFVAFVFKYSSLAALLAAALTPFYYFLGSGIIGFELWVFNLYIFASLIFICGLLIFRHRENINRLLSGAESKIGSKKK